MTAEHPRLVLESVPDTAAFHRAAQDLARAEISPDVLALLRVGRLTALQKPGGGVRGIVGGWGMRGPRRPVSHRSRVLSIHGISTFDMISRAAMLDGLQQVRGGDTVLLFVLQFYFEPSPAATPT